MNPSASDWIPKYLSRFGSLIVEKTVDEKVFYTRLLDIGFIYGVSVTPIIRKPISTLQLTKDEITKINLFHALVRTHLSVFPDHSFEKIIQDCITFYTHIEKGKKSFIKKLSIINSEVNDLEDILSARLQETNTVLKKKTTSVLTYALLYIDILAYRMWISKPTNTKNYLEALEGVVITCCFLALQSKKKKNKYDTLLIELFEGSSEYLLSASKNTKSISLDIIDSIKEHHFSEKKYILDICCIAVWDDYKMDESEFTFLQQLTNKLGFTNDELAKSLQSLAQFSDNYSEELKLFEYSNPVQQFYKHSRATVKLLILRNQKRLIKEIEESGELLVLLTKSTIRELDTEEKNKVKEQLLDICKSVPSLTIFLLPGGAVLLPLLVKLIPQLLPSSFNENRLDPKKREKP